SSDVNALYQMQAKPAHLEALAGKLTVDKPLHFDAKADLFRNGRRVRTLQGRLTLRTDKLLRFAPEGISAAELRDPLLILGPVYARLAEGIPEIASASPVIYSPGLLRVGQSFTVLVKISGIRLPERLGVTDFEGGLFVQVGQDDAGFDPSPELLVRRVREHVKLISEAITREEARPPAKQDPDLIERLQTAKAQVSNRLLLLKDCAWATKRVGQLESRLAAELAKPAGQKDDKAIASLVEMITAFRNVLLDHLRTRDNRVILGLGIAGLSFRTAEGETIRSIGPGQQIVLTLKPMGRGNLPARIDTNTETFVVIDDARTGIYYIDSMSVYVPFDRLQLLCDMDERRDMKDPTNVDPARCSQIQIKVRSEFDSGSALSAVRTKVRRVWRQFLAEHPEARWSNVIVHTWREKLSKFIGPIQKQRTLVAMMFGIVSFVSVLVIFSIFYMIVMQKIRDIGVIRAVGGTSGGVAQIFLIYGMVTGLVGSALGLTAGFFFVHYINSIQDFIAKYAGFRVWEREVFLFDKIPNEVDPAVMIVIAAWAVASGLVGALI
ncbi:hypothetical protein LCGC14_2360160, partial [marine sediment metagenome]